MIKICLIGGKGNMGQAIMQAISEAKGMFSLTKAIIREDIDSDLYCSFSECEWAIKACDVVIDFSIKENLAKVAAIAIKYQKPLINGVTGITAEQKQYLIDAANKIPIIYSENMSIPVNLIFAYIQQFFSLEEEIKDVSIIEKHHKNKKDTPSGTALKIKETVLNHMKQEKLIHIDSFREENISGEHKISIATENEIVSIRHKAYSRKAYAVGSLKAAIWISGKEKGYYTMLDVIKKQ